MKSFLKETKVKIVIGLVILAFIVAGIYLFERYRSYDKFKVLDSLKVESGADSKYEAFGEFIVKYSSDGISYIDGEETIWDEAFEMKTPIVDICDKYIAVADKNTNDIYIYNEDGKVGKASTSYPIIKIQVASQGVVAALLEDKNANYIEVFDKEGSKLVSHKTLINENGYPLNFSLSDKGTKMIVSYITIHSGVMSNKVLFYNFSNVGKSSSDRMVGEFNQYKETLVPMVQFISENDAIAIGENLLSIYSMKEKPSLKEEIKFKDEIQKVFYSDKYIGFVFKNTNNKNPYRIEAYNLSGHRIMKKEVNIQCDKVSFSGDNILMYDDMNCKIISFKGVEKFNYTFKAQINSIIPVDGKRTFLFMNNSKIQKVRLK
ncbi:DUF5711 family protein [uncultured Eubacterium sp.]|uniref:DUF5711 family protein n=1 Tax=uncultured Eubacterium sp. TaxID=165185 RepID=UPI002672503D|nr:DUF5711 family protein [uncultured Eubacterium sp.]